LLNSVRFDLAAVEAEIADAFQWADAHASRLEAFAELRSFLQSQMDRWPLLHERIERRFANITAVIERSAAWVHAASKPSDVAPFQTQLANARDEARKESLAADTLESAIQNSAAVLVDPNAVDLYVRIMDCARGIGARCLQRDVANLTDPLTIQLRECTWRIFQRVVELEMRLGTSGHLTLLQSLSDEAARFEALWRSRGETFDSAIANENAQGGSLNSLHRIGDQGLWATWTVDQNRKIVSPSLDGSGPQTFDAVTMEVDDADLSRQLSSHPAQVVWTIRKRSLIPFLYSARREIATEDLGLIYAFGDKGRYRLDSSLKWKRERITLARRKIRVRPNSDWVRASRVAGVGLAAGLFGIGFTTVAGFLPLYDATFGTAQQYLTLFLTAAAAAGGGNAILQGSARSSS
jgi:hypothetical protein